MCKCTQVKNIKTCINHRGQMKLQAQITVTPLIYRGADFQRFKLRISNLISN